MLHIRTAVIHAHVSKGSLRGTSQDGRWLLVAAIHTGNFLNCVEYLSYCELDAVKLARLVHNCILMVYQSDWFEALKLVSDVLDKGSDLVVYNFGIAFVLDLCLGLLHFAVEVNPYFFQVVSCKHIPYKNFISINKCV